MIVIDLIPEALIEGDEPSLLASITLHTGEIVDVAD